MDRLPLETLQEIFELASTDGGLTGCALSQVSSKVRAAARQSRFHSVALVVRRFVLDAFIDVYRREYEPPNEDKARVRDLRLTIPADADVRASPSLMSSLNELLRLIAQDVWFLVIHTAAGTGQAVLPYPFPALRRVTFIGLADLRPLLPQGKKDGVKTEDGKESGRGHSHPLFPAATDVRVIVPPSGSTYALDFHALAHHTPRATHLHVSNVDPSSATLSFLIDLAKRLKPLPPTFAISDAKERAWSSIRNVILQPCAPPASQGRDERGWGGDPEPKERYGRLWHFLRHVESLSRGERLGDSPEMEAMREPKTMVRLVEGREGTWEEWCEGARVREGSSRSRAMADDGRVVDAVEPRSGWAHATVLLPI